MTTRSKLLMFIMASSVMSLVATDLILPSLPHISEHFQISTATAKLLIAFFMLGQLTTVMIWGIVADRLGKLPTLVLGLLLFLVGALCSLNTTSVNWLLLSRFLQGTGSVVVPVAGWALVQDLYPKDEGARIMSWIGSIISIIPMFAPILGGKIDTLWGWEANFYCLILYALLLCFCVPFLPRAALTEKPKTPLPGQKFSIYKEIIRHKTFVGYISLFGLLNSGEWCFLTIAPFYYEHLHLGPEQIGFFLSFMALGFILGTALSAQLIKYLGINKTMEKAIQISLASSLLLLGALGLHYDSQIFYIMTISLYVLSSAILWGSTTSRALQCFENNKGAASAVRSLLLIGYAALGTFFGRLMHNDSLIPVALYFLVTALLALLISFGLGIRRLRLDPA